MPWPTTRGMRILDGAEAALVLGAIGMMVDRLVDEARDATEPMACGIDWFDQWDARQRLWLLEQVTAALFGNATIESSAAMFDATVDAIFLEVQDLIEFEINEGPESASTSSWRASVIDALGNQVPEPPGATNRLDDAQFWCRLVTHIADGILGVRLYQRAESFRDQDYRRMQNFLRDRGLPADYMERIPPLRTVDETQLSIDRIQAYVFGD